MALSHDEKLLAVSRESNSIEIWKSDSFAQIVNLPGHKNVDIKQLHWLEPKNSTRAESEEANILFYN